MKAAFLLALNDAIYLNDYDRDIEYEGQTYQADRSLAQITEIKDSAILPKLGIQVICKRKDLYQLLQADPGPIPCEMTFVEYDEATSAWATRWQFSGILGEGRWSIFFTPASSSTASRGCYATPAASFGTARPSKHATQAPPTAKRTTRSMSRLICRWTMSTRFRSDASAPTGGYRE